MEHQEANIAQKDTLKLEAKLGAKCSQCPHELERFEQLA
jgi:hypothetical protein